MLRQNISGLLKRWIGLLTRFVNRFGLGGLPKIEDTKLKEQGAVKSVSAPVDLVQPEPVQDEELDLEPVRDFMEDYVGQIIVAVSGHQELEDIHKKAVATIVTNVHLDGTRIKFYLRNLNGKNSGYLIIEPTKYGMFTEKLYEEELSTSSIYRICFLSGICLEYLDSKGMGLVSHHE